MTLRLANPASLLQARFQTTKFSEENFFKSDCQQLIKQKYWKPNIKQEEVYSKLLKKLKKLIYLAIVLPADQNHLIEYRQKIIVNGLMHKELDTKQLWCDIEPTIQLHENINLSRDCYRDAIKAKYERMWKKYLDGNKTFLKTFLMKLLIGEYTTDLVENINELFDLDIQLISS